MLTRVLLPTLVAILFGIAPAFAQTAAQRPEVYNAQNNNYTGNNTATGLNSAPHSSAECPGGTGTLTPAHNNIVCRMTGDVTLVAPTIFTDGTPIVLTVTQDGTGGHKLILPATGFAVCTSACGNNISTLLSGSNLLISSDPNSTSMVDLSSAPLPSGNMLMVRSISAGITPFPFTPTQVSGLISWGDPSDSTKLWGSANCTGAHITPTSGGAAIASISDSNSGGYCWNATGTVNAVVSGSIYYLSFNGSSYLTGCTSCSSFANASAIAQNVPSSPA